MKRATVSPSSLPPLESLFLPQPSFGANILLVVCGLMGILSLFAGLPLVLMGMMEAAFALLAVAMIFFIALGVRQMAIEAKSKTAGRAIDSFYDSRGVTLLPPQREALNFPTYRPTVAKLYCGAGLATIGGELTEVHLLWEDGRMKLCEGRDRREILPVSRS